jgi:nucleoside-diphosphate-sugar epimerase
LTKETPSIVESYDIVIHCAGKAHTVPKSKSQADEFYETNVKGTGHLLTALSHKLPTAFVFISSVAVYGVETGSLLSESIPLLASDPYGKSKIEAEQLVSKWCAKHSVICTILRLPLIAGTNPPGNLGAMIAGIRRGYYFNIEGGKAKRSCVLVKDIAEAIPVVARIGGIYNLTDGLHPSFLQLSTHIARLVNSRVPLNVPLWLARLLGKIGDIVGDTIPLNTLKVSKLTSDLTFSDEKARAAFNWSPNPVVPNLQA